MPSVGVKESTRVEHHAAFHCTRELVRRELAEFRQLVADHQRVRAARRRAGVGAHAN